MVESGMGLTNFWWKFEKNCMAELVVCAAQKTDKP
jgi:hypothetical protein